MNLATGLKADGRGSRPVLGRTTLLVESAIMVFVAGGTAVPVAALCVATVAAAWAFVRR